MSWALLTRLLEESQNHSTFVGKLWLTVLIVFRIVLTVVGGESIYYDERSKFLCNTLQPGCDNMCYDAFAPLSHVRFWVFQIVLITTPLLVYLGYAVNKIARMEKQADGRDVRKPKKHHCLCSRKQHLGFEEAENDHVEEQVIDEVVELLTDGAGPAKGDSGDSQTNVRTRHDGHRYIQRDGLMCIYVFQLLVRTLLEAAFLWGQYYLYGFSVPHTFLCSVDPCPHTVSCYVSRPSEKTIFLLIMYAVSVLCLLLNIVEMIHLGVRAVCDIVSCCCCVKTLDEEDRLTQAELTSEDPNRCSSSHNISSSYRDNIKPCVVFTRNYDKGVSITDLAKTKMTSRQNHMNIVQGVRQQHNIQIDNLAGAGLEYDPQSVRNDLSQSKKKPRADTQVYCDWQGLSNNHSRAHTEGKHQRVNGHASSKADADSSHCSTEWV
ncbi:gap junction gamma-1 protein-like [Solea senegalensis]|uniref:Gap junction gamma-1 protein-like n=1 Tax=Solea senegalensis TaxID=28829 RepID=A0AAV6RQN8_SOLSE|nr:gap junction gamma-1 protein-like [Solea senegalensis]KAG7507746.1 gap junction gamma-1 protein-like [Solea senegalensis]